MTFLASAMFFYGRDSTSKNHGLDARDLAHKLLSSGVLSPRAREQQASLITASFASRQEKIPARRVLRIPHDYEKANRTAESCRKKNSRQRHERRSLLLCEHSTGNGLAP